MQSATGNYINQRSGYVCIYRMQALPCRQRCTCCSEYVFLFKRFHYSWHSWLQEPQSTSLLSWANILILNVIWMIFFCSQNQTFHCWRQVQVPSPNCKNRGDFVRHNYQQLVLVLISNFKQSVCSLVVDFSVTRSESYIVIPVVGGKLLSLIKSFNSFVQKHRVIKKLLSEALNR